MPEYAGQLPVRASDADREHAVALLQTAFAEGRLTTAELTDRSDAAYQALTTQQLADLTADIPHQADSPAVAEFPFLTCLLVCLCPPAGIIWLLYNRHRADGPPQARAGCGTSSDRLA